MFVTKQDIGKVHVFEDIILRKNYINQNQKYLNALLDEKNDIKQNRKDVNSLLDEKVQKKQKSNKL